MWNDLITGDTPPAEPNRVFGDPPRTVGMRVMPLFLALLHKKTAKELPLP
jgi:hypothetical protein